MIRFILLIGMAPAILLLLWIYHLDSVEHEPPELILKLFLCGGLTTFVAALLESIGEAILQVFVNSQANPFLYDVLMYFVVVACVEEGGKHFVARKLTWRNSEFNYRFDAIVYTAAASLGFAAFENVMYIFSFSVTVAPIRAVTAIPLHCIAGIFMGHYYGQAKYCYDTGMTGRYKYYMFLSMLVPVLIHGFYDFCASSQNSFFAGIFLSFVIILDIFAFFAVKRYSRDDSPA